MTWILPTQFDKPQLTALIKSLDEKRLTEFTDILQDAVDSLEDHDALKAAGFLIGALQSLEETDIPPFPP